MKKGEKNEKMYEDNEKKARKAIASIIEAVDEAQVETIKIYIKGNPSKAIHPSPVKGGRTDVTLVMTFVAE